MSPDQSRQITSEEQYETSDFDFLFHRYNLQSQLNAVQHSEMIDHVDFPGPSTTHTGNAEPHVSGNMSSQSALAVHSSPDSEAPKKRPRNMHPCINCKGIARYDQKSDNDPCERCTEENWSCVVKTERRFMGPIYYDLTARRQVTEEDAYGTGTSQESSQQDGASPIVTGQVDISFDDPKPQDQSDFRFDNGLETNLSDHLNDGEARNAFRQAGSTAYFQAAFHGGGIVGDAAVEPFDSAFYHESLASIPHGTTQTFANCETGQRVLAPTGGAACSQGDAGPWCPATIMDDEAWKAYLNPVYDQPEPSFPET